jgi:hypothetical protein
VVEVHTRYGKERYLRTTRHLPGDGVAPAAFADVVVPVDEILG